MSVVEHEFELPAPRPTAFDLLADPRRLDDLTPSWFRLRPVDSPARLGVGAEINYRLRWRRLPLRWTSRIVTWRPPHELAYVQGSGPFVAFRHEHAFAISPAATRIRDRVTFHAPGGRLVDVLLVAPDLRRVLAYRERRAREILREAQAGAPALRGASFMPSTSASSSPIERPT